jgi:hypothetical protein
VPLPITSAAPGLTPRGQLETAHRRKRHPLSFRHRKEGRLPPIVHRKRACAPVLSCKDKKLQLDNFRQSSRPVRRPTEPARSTQQRCQGRGNDVRRGLSAEQPALGSCGGVRRCCPHAWLPRPFLRICPRRAGPNIGIPINLRHSPIAANAYVQSVAGWARLCLRAPVGRLSGAAM